MDGSDDEMDYAPNEDIAEHVETNYPLNQEVEVPGTKGQLFKTVLQEGTGPKPPKDSKVSVHYVGTLASDGSKFDSSRDRDERFEFTLGKGQVIKGWDQGVATMRKGEKAILRCLPEYAYGKAGSPPKIPADATLNFEVELFDWTKMEDISEKKDKSLMKSVLAEGKDWDRPDYESEVTLNLALLSGSEEDATTLFEKPQWKVTIGDTELPTGLEKALESMKKGEIAVIAVTAVTAPFAELPQLVVGQPAYYRVEVVDFVKVKTWSVTNENKVAEAKKRKDAGNEYFKQSKFEKAVRKYKRGLEFIEYVDGLPEEQKSEAKTLKVSMWSNTAQCFMNQKNFKNCIEYCNKVLKEEPSNVKALFRRGKALGLAQEWDDGAKDLKKVLEIDPTNGDAKNELDVINAKISEHLKKQKAQYQRMFA